MAMTQRSKRLLDQVRQAIRLVRYTKPPFRFGNLKGYSPRLAAGRYPV